MRAFCCVQHEGTKVAVAGQRRAMGERVGEIRRLLWGGHPNERVFRSWSQGFTFSSREPSALVQLEGGPCAVLAPVQAFILRDMVAAGVISAKDDEWRFTAAVSRDEHLVSAVCSILLQARYFHCR